MAGNQLGKTLSGAMEATMHATGLYPDWWEGKRYKRSNIGWVGGITGEVIRDTTQRLLIGRVEANQLGQGAIPKDKILGIQKAMGTPNLMDHVKVQHVDGGISVIFFKSYANGRQKFQGETIDWIWFDEEPPQDIYNEGLTRTNANGQFGILTYTPLLGMTSVTNKFLSNPSENQVVINMTIDDVEHYTEEEKQIILDSYPEHEKEARAKGIPIMGSGRIFTVAEEKISEDPLTEIPKHWPQINGLDFGWDHPQACVNLAWDRDSDVIHVTKEFRESKCTPILAAPAIKPWGKWVPTAWPHDGYQHDKGSGKELSQQYRDAGLNMLHKHATHPEGGNGVEAGIMEMLDRMQTGRFKVGSDLVKWFEEFRMYHRKDGKIVKERDDLMAATRYAVMMIRKAKTNTKTTELEFASLW
jgi:phage terminase large subunit-like protein